MAAIFAAERKHSIKEERFIFIVSKQARAYSIADGDMQNMHIINRIQNLRKLNWIVEWNKTINNDSNINLYVIRPLGSYKDWVNW